MAQLVIIDYHAFVERAEWQGYIEYLYEEDMNRKDIVAMEAKPFVVDTEVKVRIN